MTAPNEKIQFALPDQMIPTTYPEFVQQLDCICAGGAIIQPSPLPSATLNLGDVIADHARILSSFTSAYGMITIVIRMIACIIDVICALMNPFSVIFAIIRLFGTCLPDFILIFPQLAVPAIIICIIKIVLAIVEYVLEVIIPLIDDIISNVEMLRDAFTNNNADAQQAIAFKIVSLFKSLENILGILATLLALWKMIEALLALGIAIPCGDSGCCGDQCPETIQQNSITATDGVMIVLYGSNRYDYDLRFFSSSKQSEFLTIRDFFPKGFNYDQVTEEDDLVYTLVVDGNTYSVTSVDRGGTANLSHIQSEFATDGYLSDIAAGFVLTDPLQTRFGTGTQTFDSSFVNRYIELQEKRQDADAAQANNGTWRIQSIYDAYNVLLVRDEDTWDAYNIVDPLYNVGWRMTPIIPSTGGNKIFNLNINHEELIRHDLISLGCHPAVQASKDGFNNRFPEAQDLTLPTLPDLDQVIIDVTACLRQVAPASIDTQWVLDNYDHIAQEIGGLESCISDTLNQFQDEMLDYVGEIYAKVFDKEGSLINANPLTQIVGHNSNITVVPLDKNGGRLAVGLPAGTIDVDIQTTAGFLSPVTEVVDAYGAPTGDFIASLTNHMPLMSDVTATVDGYYISDFDGYNLIPRVVEVQFVDPSYLKRGDDKGSVEPLGVK